jgi:hypothetical protein
MKFIMVIIICFGVDCEAIFDKAKYETYDECYKEAVVASKYMQNAYPQSAGEVHCWDDKQFSTFNEFIKNGGKPTIKPELLPEQSNSV